METRSGQFSRNRSFFTKWSMPLTYRQTSNFVVTSSSFVALLQLTPFLFLGAREFGYYSIVQLVYILGSSVSLSLINEADARRTRDGNPKGDWKDFSAIAFWVSILFAVIAAVLSWNIATLKSYTLLSALAVGLAVYRGIVRYRLVQEKLLKRLIFGDFLGILTYLITGCLFYFSLQARLELREILIMWFAGQAVSTLFTRYPASISPVRSIKWVRTRRTQIAVLTPDSALQDMGAVWGPSLIAVVLDVVSLGIYRAVTTVAAPIRLILTPLRPLLTKHASTTQYTLRSFGKVVLIASVLGFLSAMALLALDATEYRAGVLNDLSQFFVPVGLYVASNFINFFYSVQARIALPVAKLLTTRALQAVSLGLAPVLFAFVSGLSGAIWSLGIGSVILSIMWIIMLKIYGKAGQVPQVEGNSEPGKAQQ